MTEQQWLTCTDCDAMLRFLQGGIGDRLLARLGMRQEKISRRKLRLFYCACAREDPKLANEPTLIEFIQMAEAFAEGALPVEAMREASDRIAGLVPSYQSFLAWRACDTSPRFAGLLFLATDHMGAGLSYAAEVIPRLEPHESPAFPEFGRLILAHERDPSSTLLRDIFRPFRTPTVDASWLSWNHAAIPRLASAIHETANFANLPILADALEEAGCRDEGILEHCRQPQAHFRGCWVVDALLDKR